MDTFTALITEICAENHIDCEILSYGWIYKLSYKNTARYIIGRHFELNSSASDRIACDKYACSTILINKGIPCIRHELFFDPLRRSNWIGKNGEIDRAARFFYEYSEKVVAKPNNGWQGRNVFFCESMKDIEYAFGAIFAHEPTACLSPFYQITNEYRVFYLSGECLYSYGKKKGGASWKHNLSAGAVAFDIEDDSLLKKLYSLAADGAKCINISFAAIDIAQLPDGALKIMEINSGVVASKLLEQHPDKYGLVKKIYTKAVHAMFSTV